MSQTHFRVLSIDGGGMRGTYTATYLQRVAAAFAKQRNIASLDIGAGFDLIVGTSTGGIIACALAVGVPLGDVVTLYAENGTAIFERALPTGVMGLAADQMQRSSALSRGTAVLKAALEKRLGQKTLGQVYAERGIRLAIPAVEMSQHRGWVFKTPHLAGTSHRDDNTKLTDVCLATSAAPIYRSLAVVEHSDGASDGYNVFADGGLWSNNPVLVGLVDALDCAAPGQPIEIYCLGTCPMPSGEQIPRAAVHRSLADWKFGGEAASLSIDAQQFALDHMAKKLARHVDRPCSVIRFPSDKVPAALIPYLGLDDTRPEAVQALINQARTDADMTNSKCAYADTDPEAQLICTLFHSIPERTDPLVSRWPLAPAAGSPPEADEVAHA
jgi:uncharacterized protein